MRGMHKNPDRFIDGVVAHMQVFFCDPSLGTQIKIKVSSSLVIFYGVSDFIIFQTTGKNTYHKGKKLHALDENFELKALQNWIRKTAYQNANLWVVFSNTNKDGVMGKAFIGTLCKDQQENFPLPISFSEFVRGKGQSKKRKYLCPFCINCIVFQTFCLYLVLLAKTALHEVGHNMGLHHKGRNGHCCKHCKNSFKGNGGMIKVGLPRGQVWTDRNKDDFYYHFLKVTEKQGRKWCLPGIVF